MGGYAYDVALQNPTASKSASVYAGEPNTLVVTYSMGVNAALGSDSSVPLAFRFDPAETPLAGLGAEDVTAATVRGPALRRPTPNCIGLRPRTAPTASAPGAR